MDEVQTSFFLLENSAFCPGLPLSFLFPKRSIETHGAQVISPEAATLPYSLAISDLLAQSFNDNSDTTTAFTSLISKNAGYEECRYRTVHTSKEKLFQADSMPLSF